MEDQRRWEELDMDCLVKVFGRVGMESLLLDVPFVCKSWYKASLNPSCWKQLVFPDFEPEFAFEGVNYPIYDRFVSEYRVDKDRFSETEFIKFIVNRSCGKAISIKLPGCCKAEVFEYVANVCPDVKVLGLAKFLLNEDINLELIGKWENLLVLSLGCTTNLEKILAVVSTHCKYFFHLRVASCAHIGKNEALAIVNLVPKLKCLSLSRASIDRDNLVILLQGCKDLEFLDVRYCTGFDEGDEEISQLASNINQFMCEGSKVVYPFHLFDSFVFTEACVNEIASIASMSVDVDGEGEGEH